jgi:TetR/AcrR family transcriptional regulator, regulator of mycofactocin system
MPPPSSPSLRGRPVATSHAAIEQAAFELFAERGFAGTTLDDIAAAVGVSRRTVLRYYGSKNDIPWGQFDLTLDGFRATLEAMPEELALHEAVHRGVVEFNRFPPDVSPPHRDRMRLILSTPELEAHSVHQYAAWREVIAAYVARRLSLADDDLLPRTVGHVSLALAVSAYETWLEDPAAGVEELLDLLERALSGLRSYLSV